MPGPACAASRASPSAPTASSPTERTSRPSRAAHPTRGGPPGPPPPTPPPSAPAPAGHPTATGADHVLAALADAARPLVALDPALVGTWGRYDLALTHHF